MKIEVERGASRHTAAAPISAAAIRMWECAHSCQRTQPHTHTNRRADLAHRVHAQLLLELVARRLVVADGDDLDPLHAEVAGLEHLDERVAHGAGRAEHDDGLLGGLRAFWGVGWGGFGLRRAKRARTRGGFARASARRRRRRREATETRGARRGRFLACSGLLCPKSRAQGVRSLLFSAMVVRAGR